MADDPSSTAPPEPRRISIRLPRPLWIGVVAVILIVGGVALRIGLSTSRQHAAIREIERVGGDVECEWRGPDWMTSGWISWVWDWLDEEWLDSFDTVVEVRLGETGASDETLSHVRGLAGVRGLDLDGTQITDAGLTYVKELRELETLSLCDTQITDAGLAHLARLKKLKAIFLARTRVTDAGIAELKRSLPKVTVYMRGAGEL